MPWTAGGGGDFPRWRPGRARPWHGPMYRCFLPKYSKNASSREHTSPQKTTSYWAQLQGAGTQTGGKAGNAPPPPPSPPPPLRLSPLPPPRPLTREITPALHKLSGEQKKRKHCPSHRRGEDSPGASANANMRKRGNYRPAHLPTPTAQAKQSQKGFKRITLGVK